MHVATGEPRAKYSKIGSSLQQQLQTIINPKEPLSCLQSISSEPAITCTKVACPEYHSSQHKKIVRFKPLMNKASKMSSHYSKATRNAHRRRSNQGPVSYKSLNCSFVRVEQSDASSSHRSIKALNPQISLCKHYLQEILKKLSLFRQSLFSEKQMVSWISPYCRKQRAILFKLFFIHRQHAQLSLETDSDVLQTNMESKLRDSYTNCHRFVTAQEMQNFDQFLQQLYVEKNTIKMREMEHSIRESMRKVCTHVRNYHNNEYFIGLRKKPVQISRLLQDLHEFEEKTGVLKKVSALHRNRFDLVNETDLLVDLQAVQLNKEVEHCRKKCDFQVLDWPMVRVALR